MTETTGRRTVFTLAVAVALGLTLAGCANTMRGVEQDSRKIFGTIGNGSSTGDDRSGSTQKTGTWKNPE